MHSLPLSPLVISFILRDIYWENCCLHSSCLTRIAKAACKLLKACKLNKVSANLLQALPRHLCRCGSRFRSFQAVHTLQDTGSSTPHL